MSQFSGSDYNNYYTNPAYHSDIELPLIPARASYRDKRSAGTDEIELTDYSDTKYDPLAWNADNPPAPRNNSVDRLHYWLGTDRAWKHARSYLKLDDEDGATHPARGWRTAVVAAASVTGIVLLINTTFAIVAVFKFKVFGGIGTIYEGNCELVKRWDTAIHLAINVLGTALLAASSFTMQCVSSPTRTEIDQAHAKRKSLDIGLASFKNLFYMRPRKRLLWLGLCLSTIPLHLLWNSTIFASNSTNYFSYLVVSENFLSGAAYTPLNASFTVDCVGERWTMTSDIIPAMLRSYQENRFTYLSAKDCLNAYDVDTLTDRRNLIIVTNPTAGMNVTGCGYRRQAWNGSSVLAIQTDCMPGDLTWALPPNTTEDESNKQMKQSLEIGDTWSVGSVYKDPTGTATRYPVEYCLSETVGVSRCALQFVPYILYIVAACNFVKFVCMSFVAYYFWDLNEPILATIGDAVTSFLERPDKTTQGWCLMDLSALISWREGKNPSEKQMTYSRPATVKLYHATSRTRWWWTVSPCTLYLAVGFLLFGLSLELGSDGDVAAEMRVKFGAVNGDMLLGVGHDDSGTSTGAGLIVDILVANSFQVALSTTYFLYNSLYTAQCTALEWSSYIQGRRKSLRVTWPRGQQRSTYYLQLPYRYGIPLTILLIAMHFLISQSIFLARLQYYYSDGSPSDRGFSDVGFSASATITTCSVGFAMIVAQIINSCRKLDNRMPIQGNSSVVISALCHTEVQSGDAKLRRLSSAEVDKDASSQNISTKPLTWGVTRQPNEHFASRAYGHDENLTAAGHCTFSDTMVELPQTGKMYR